MTRRLDEVDRRSARSDAERGPGLGELLRDLVRALSGLGRLVEEAVEERAELGREPRRALDHRLLVHAARADARGLLPSVTPRARPALHRVARRREDERRGELREVLGHRLREARAELGVAHARRPAEVHDLQGAVGADADVHGGHVAVGDAPLVERVERGRELASRPGDLGPVERPPAPHEVEERDAVGDGERVVEVSAALAVVHDAREARMLDLLQDVEREEDAGAELGVVALVELEHDLEPVRLADAPVRPAEDARLEGARDAKGTEYLGRRALRHEDGDPPRAPAHGRERGRRGRGRSGRRRGRCGGGAPVDPVGRGDAVVLLPGHGSRLSDVATTRLVSANRAPRSRDAREPRAEGRPPEESPERRVRGERDDGLREKL